MNDFQRILKACLQINEIYKHSDYYKRHAAIKLREIGVKAFRNANSPIPVDIIRNHYGAYFTRIATRTYRAEWSLLLRDFPADLKAAGGPTVAARLPTVSPPPQSRNLPVEEIIKALKDEIWATKRQAEKSPLYAKFKQQFHWNIALKYHYEFALFYEGDEELPIQESMPVRLKWAVSEVQGTILTYDPSKQTLIIETESILSGYQLDTAMSILPNSEHLIKALIDRMETLSPKNQLAWPLLTKKPVTGTCEWNKQIYFEQLDESQQEVVRFALKNQLTYIWGPPGTGKTHTLGRLINNLLGGNERILIASISNVAVDGVAKQLIKAFGEGGDGKKLLDKGKVLRFGFPVLEEVRKEERLFPDRPRIKELLDQLSYLQEQKKKFRDNKEKVAELKAKEKEVQQKIKEVTQQFICESRIVLTTATQANLEQAFQNANWDTVIIDEGGMMPIPYVLSLAALSAKRLIVAGDFRQLGPIALAATPEAQKWLHRDAFALIGVDGHSIDHPNLRMLKIQRRMHPEICALIRQPFYKGELETATNKAKLTATNYEPKAKIPIVWIREEGEVEQTTSSRMNRTTAETTCKWATALVRTYRDIKVGIITPYRGQVSYIRRQIHRQKDLKEEQRERIKIGTIHAFQGDESDIIILDLCDNMKKGAGRLYHYAVGDRLVNVAVSRAQGKLIIVGDLNLFIEGPNHNKMGKFAGCLQTHIINQPKYHYYPPSRQR